MKKNVLVTLADANYIDQAKQLFSSVYWNAGWDGDYLLLAHDIPESELVWFERKGIYVYRCGPVGDANPKDAYPITVFSKFHIFKEYFKKWNKIVYLDADIIIRGSLEGLERVKGFGAKADFEADLVYQINLGHDWTKAESEELSGYMSRLSADYDLTSTSFNSGVMVIDTGLIHADSFDRLIRLWEEYKTMSHYGDQLFLNLMMYRVWCPIEDFYNSFLVGPRVMRSYLRHGAGVPVLHFLGSPKPWKEGHPFLYLWRTNLVMAEGIDLSAVPSVPRQLPSDIPRLRKIVRKNERSLVEVVRLYCNFRKLDRHYQKKDMEEFRCLLIHMMRKRYSLMYNRYIPYYFISYVPQNPKERIKALLRKLKFRIETESDSSQP